MRNSTVIGRIGRRRRASELRGRGRRDPALGRVELPGQGDLPNASQIVTGDQVEVAGNADRHGVEHRADAATARRADAQPSTTRPTRRCARARRRPSARRRCRAIANRYVDLRLGPGERAADPQTAASSAPATRPAPSTSTSCSTRSTPPTRKGLQNVIQGSASQYAGRGQQAQVAWQYLNPAIASSSMLFREINRDTGEVHELHRQVEQPRLRHRAAPAPT